MNQKTQLIERLNSVNATQFERMKLAEELQGDPESIALLIELMAERTDEIGIRAAWVLEWICRSDVTPILPHLEDFTTCLNNLKPDGSIRAAAKICALLTGSQISGTVKHVISEAPFRARVISTCFDWLIGPFSIATKAYSMQTLFELGTNESWVHEELKAILQQNYSSESAGYRARARKVLNLMEKPR